jgi:hypothetical protein
MKILVILMVLSLASLGARADFSCPAGTNAACLEEGDSVCPVSAKCVGYDAVCLQADSCDSARGFICGSEYDALVTNHENVVAQYNQLISENVDLRETRLQQKNCVINAQSLKEAIRCVR